MGGSAAVSNTVENQLKEFGETSRYFGGNRYATSTAIAKKFFPLQTSIIFASGKDFADGLCASNLGEYPLILIDNNFTYEARKYLTQLNPALAKVIGGTGVIDDSHVNWALTKLETIAK
jgi:putative cell wall-binding protein